MKNQTSKHNPPIISQTQHTETSIKNFSLDGVHTLYAEKISTTYIVEKRKYPSEDEPIFSRKALTVNSTPMSFDLEEVTVDELLEFRKETPCFVLKKGQRYFLAIIPKDISFVSCDSLGKHMCGICQRLSAASDEKGGCAKVRARSYFIERYPWIKYGIETFNTHHDAFIVFECENFSPYREEKKVSPLEKTQMIVGLAQHIYENIDNMAEVRKVIKQNLGNI